MWETARENQERAAAWDQAIQNAGGTPPVPSDSNDGSTKVLSSAARPAAAPAPPVLPSHFSSWADLRLISRLRVAGAMFDSCPALMTAESGARAASGSITGALQRNAVYLAMGCVIRSWMALGTAGCACTPRGRFPARFWEQVRRVLSGRAMRGHGRGGGRGAFGWATGRSSSLAPSYVLFPGKRASTEDPTDGSSPRLTGREAARQSRLAQ